MTHVFMAIITIAYLIVATVMDIREKKIYTFPCTILTVLWGMFILSADAKVEVVYVMWIINFVIYIAFNAFRIWGAGDSDLLLMCVDIMIYAFSPQNVVTGIFVQCVCLAIALSVSIIVGTVELKVRGKKISFKDKVAVAPGLSVVTTALIIIGVARRIM